MMRMLEKKKVNPKRNQEKGRVSPQTATQKECHETLIETRNGFDRSIPVDRKTRARKKIFEQMRGQDETTKRVFR